MNIITFVHAHLSQVLTGLGAGVAGILGHAFGPALYKLAGDKLTAAMASGAALLFKKMIQPDLKDPDDYRNVSEMARNAIEMAERHMKGAAGQAKMGWVLDMLCAKTGLDRAEAGVIAQKVFDAQAKAAADALAASPQPTVALAAPAASQALSAPAVAPVAHVQPPQA